MKKLIIYLIILSFQLPLSAYMLQACLDNIDKEAEKQCGRFFGSGNFCSTCTNECINQYKETDPTRTECLQVCFRNPACS